MTSGRSLGKKRGKLWHFAAVVLAVALLLGVARSFASGMQGPAEFALAAAITISGSVAASVAIIRVGRERAGWATSRLKRWGIARDGFVGLLAYLVGIGAEVAFVGVAIVIGTVATFALIGGLGDLIAASSRGR